MTARSLFSTFALLLIPVLPLMATAGETPRVSEDMVYIQYTEHSYSFAVRDIEVTGNLLRLKMIGWRDGETANPRVTMTAILTLKSDQTARILADAFQWTTEVGLYIVDSGWVPKTIANYDQSKILFVDVDGALGDLSKERNPPGAVTIDELEKWVGSRQNPSPISPTIY